MKPSDILIVSTVCSNDFYDNVSKTRTKKSLDPAQRVFHTLAKELVSMGNSVTCISAVPYSRNNTNINEFQRKEEMVDGVRYIYPSFRLGMIERILDLRSNGRHEIRKWIENETPNSKIVICDSLVVPLSSEARKMCKHMGIKCVAYVTDYPSMATNIKTSKKSIKSFFQFVFDKYADNDIRKYDGYIVVAEKLVELIRAKCNRYIVIEDIADFPECFDREKPNNNKFTIVYGGALCERFGINKLVDSIMLMDNTNVEMLFYGSGESVDYIQDMAKKDNRIKYGGLLTYDELQIKQKQADLLVNPRPSNEVFSAYSFPSKTTSYMVSGTPVITTRIPGIPEEYFEHLLFFVEEDTVSIAKKLDEVSRLPSDELYSIGKDAFVFLSTEKNAKKQCGRIELFINSLAV